MGTARLRAAILPLCDMDVGPTGIADRLTGGVLAARPPRARFGWRAGGARIQRSACWPAHGSADRQTASVFARSRGPALFWRLAIGNAAVLAAACTITALVFSPERRGRRAARAGDLRGGLALMLALNLLLLRRALAPLRELTAFARRIDPLEPGHRLEVGGGDSEAAELAAAFNEMLERLEAERRDSVAPRAGRAGGRAAARRAGAPRRRRPVADRRRAAARPRRPRRARAVARAA